MKINSQAKISRSKQTLKTASSDCLIISIVSVSDIVAEATKLHWKYAGSYVNYSYSDTGSMYHVIT